MMNVIGLSAGAYVLTMMISLLLRPGEPLPVKICAGVTAIMAVFMMGWLIGGSQ